MRDLLNTELANVCGGDIISGGFSGSGVFTSDAASDMSSAVTSSAGDINAGTPSLDCIPMPELLMS